MEKLEADNREMGRRLHGEMARDGPAAPLAGAATAGAVTAGAVTAVTGRLD